MPELRHEKLDEAVDAFAKAMKQKLNDKEDCGWTGWASNDEFWPAECREKLVDHIESGDPVDVANFAMFLWNLREPTHDVKEQNDA